jgi:uncharacterized membrane protein
MVNSLVLAYVYERMWVESSMVASDRRTFLGKSIILTDDSTFTL